MRLSRGIVLLVFLWCIFMGITAISIGVGALYPPINYIARPLVCPAGRMTVEEQTYTVSPVETVTTITSYCVDSQTGARTELSMWPTSLFAGTIYGLVLFFVIILGIWWLEKRASAATRARANSGDPSY